MGIVTIHTCDKCGFAQPSENGGKAPDRRTMHNINITVYDGPIYMSAGNTKVHYAALWCEKCLLERHITKPYRRRDDPEPPPTPSFEDMLREIIREEISNA